MWKEVTTYAETEEKILITKIVQYLNPLAVETEVHVFLSTAKQGGKTFGIIRLSVCCPQFMGPTLFTTSEL